MRIIVEVNAVADGSYSDEQWEEFTKNAVSSGRYVYGGYVCDPPEDVSFDMTYIGVLDDPGELPVEA